MIKLLGGNATDGVVWDNKEGSLKFEVDRTFDGIDLDEEDLEVEVEVEGLPMVAAPSSKRADGVLQHLVPSNSKYSDWQQYVAGKLYPTGLPHSQTCSPLPESSSKLFVSRS